MVTTGELRAIIEELQLVDIGDAASYLGEEAMVGEVDAINRVPTNGAAATAQAVVFSVPVPVEEVNGVGSFLMSAQ